MKQFKAAARVDTPASETDEATIFQEALKNGDHAVVTIYAAKGAYDTARVTNVTRTFSGTSILFKDAGNNTLVELHFSAKVNL